MSASDLTVFGTLTQALGEAYSNASGAIWLEFNTGNGRVVDDAGVERIGAGAATLASDGSLTVSGIPAPSSSTNPTSFQCRICYDVRAVLANTRDKRRETGDFGWMTITPTTRTVTNKALTSNVATLTVSEAHGLKVGQTITVTGVDSTFNGTYTLTAVTATTLSYAKTATNVASVASGGTLTSNYVALTMLEEEQYVPPEYLTTVTEQLQGYVDDAASSATSASGDADAAHTDRLATEAARDDAAASESSASTSETAAATSATNAATSEANAGTSATAAETARTEVEGIAASVEAGILGGRSVAFTTAGAGTWTVPADVHYLWLNLLGGGGGGGGAGSTSTGALQTGGSGGGAGGSYRSLTPLAVTPGDVISYTVGDGGTGGTGGAAGGNIGTVGTAGGKTSIVVGGTTYWADGGGYGRTSAANQISGSNPGGFATPTGIGPTGGPGTGCQAQINSTVTNPTTGGPFTASPAEAGQCGGAAGSQVVTGSNLGGTGGHAFKTTSTEYPTNFAGSTASADGGNGESADMPGCGGAGGGGGWTGGKGGDGGAGAPGRILIRY